MKKLRVAFAALLLALPLQGCGTLISIAEPHCWDAEFGIYSGVRFDVNTAAGNPSTAGTILLCLDVLPSLALDTLLLPVSVFFSIFDDPASSP